MKYNRNIKHPTNNDFIKSGYFYYSDFYFCECEIGEYYEKWTRILLDGGIKLDFDVDDLARKHKETEYEPDIIKFSSDAVYTEYTYKFIWNLRSINGVIGGFELTDDHIKLFSELFLTDGWKDEYDYVTTNNSFKYNTLTGDFDIKVSEKNTKYSDNYGVRNQ